MLRTIPLLALGLLSSCISAQDDVIELDVEHSVEIEFFSTEAGVAEEAVVIFDDLPSNADFQTNQDAFICAGLDLHASHFTVTDFATQTDEVYVDLTIEIDRKSNV